MCSCGCPHLLAVPEQEVNVEAVPVYTLVGHSDQLTSAIVLHYNHRRLRHYGLMKVKSQQVSVARR